jgi:hypothetical protein
MEHFWLDFYGVKDQNWLFEKKIDIISIIFQELGDNSLGEKELSLLKSIYPAHNKTYMT